MTSNQLAKLKKNIALLQRLANPKGGLKAKRTFLVNQKGGISPFLVPALGALFTATGAAASAARTVKAYKKK